MPQTALVRRATLAGGALLAVTVSVTAAAVFVGAIGADGIETAVMPVAAMGVEPIGPAVDVDSVTDARRAAHAAYQNEHARTELEPQWTGNVEACESGTISVEYQQQQVDRINYYRAVAGLEHAVQLDTEMSVEAQAAALIVKTNAAVHHNPSPDAACFSDTGATGSFNSNLYQRTGDDALRGFIEDPGEANVSVGHRNWLLMPQLRKVGIGEVPTVESDIDGGYAINFRNGFELEQDATPVAWPAAGWFPEELVDERWSLSIYGADFSDATVSVSRNGVAVDAPIVFNELRPGVLPASIITFTPEGVGEHFDGDDTEYTVVIDNVVSDAGSRIEYTVSTFDAGAPIIG